MDEREKISYITRMYSELTFLEIYQKELVFVVLLTIFEIVAITYFYLFKNSKFFKENWQEFRCNWTVIPFAGFINKPDNKTIAEYTKENYNYCTDRSMKLSMNEQFESKFQTQSFINDMITGMNDLIAKTISASNTSNKDVNDNIDDGTNVIYNIFGKLHVGFVLLMDILRKLSKILETIVNFALTGITWGTLFFKMLISSVMLLLIVLFTTTVIPVLPVIWLWPPLIIFPLVFIFLIVVSGTFKQTVFMIVNELSKVEPFTGMKPKLNLCFGGETMINTKNGYKKIKHVKVGDILKDKSIVTATFKTVAVSNVFVLDGIVVSGEHYVKHKNWIKVKDHPKSLPFFYKKCLYCLNTTSKKIKIRNHVFLDWDDLHPKRRKRVMKKHVDYGFSPLFLIKMVNGEYKQIIDIEPNDILNENIRVVATVCLDKKFHIVTDRGYFINEKFYMDYNFNIDKLFYLF
uniref:Hedgehog/Intein (Hint) domain-containing protein n=1 Tax=viral metagenome TaxID=1070528 RepID=A0A6C0HS75_9ZZZZ